MAEWIDPEEGLRALLAAKTSLTLNQIGTWPVGALPKLDGNGDAYVSIEVIDGGATELEDEPIFEVNGWFASTSKAKLVMQEILDAVLRYPRSVMVGERRFVIDNPRVNSRPTREEWTDTKVRRMSAMIQFSVRR